MAHKRVEGSVAHQLLTQLSEAGGSLPTHKVNKLPGMASRIYELKREGLIEAVYRLTAKGERALVIARPSLRKTLTLWEFTGRDPLDPWRPGYEPVTDESQIEQIRAQALEARSFW